MFVALFAAAMVISVIHPAITALSASMTAGAIVGYLLLKLLRVQFARRYGRQPRDTAFDFSEGLGVDRMYNVLATGLVPLVVGILFFPIWAHQ